MVNNGYKNVGENQSPTLWLDIKADIETKILYGTYAAGERIPSTRKIAQYYGIGQSTAQRVLNALLREGIVESKSGIGFFVKPYIREQLVSKKKQALEKKLIELIDEATLLDVDFMSMAGKLVDIRK